MLEVIAKNSKYITLRMPIRLSRSIFGELEKEEKVNNSKNQIKATIVKEDYPTAGEEKIFKKYRNTESSKLKDISILFKKYNFK